MRLPTGFPNTRVLAKCGFSALVVVMLALCVTCTAFGQSTGTLTGTVTDPKGLAMTGVNVQIHNADTGVDLKPIATTDAGVYVMPLLPPGTYDITASQTGFASVQHKGVTLQVGETVRVDIEMPVAGQQSLVTVTTEVPILETEKTEQSQNITENMVSDLPVSSRRWEQFALLAPGANYDGASGQVSFHGINSMYNENSVDGANNNGAYDNTTRGGPGLDSGYVYSSDSIREFAVKTSSYSAELGAAGASVNAVTKSGTAQFHGDLFYNGRSPIFNAYDPVSKTSAAASGTSPSQAILQQHQFGGSLGGPLIKDKLFFFVTYDGFRRVQPQPDLPTQLSPPINQLTCPTVAAGAPAGTTAPTLAQCQAIIGTPSNPAAGIAFQHFLGVFPETRRNDIGRSSLITKQTRPIT